MSRSNLQYEYVSVCSWGGPSDADGSITCRIDSSLLEPFFGMPPVSMGRSKGIGAHFSVLETTLLTNVSVSQIVLHLICMDGNDGSDKKQGEMRKFSREKFADAQALCDEAVANIVEEYHHLALFRLKLLLSPDDFFSRSDFSKTDGTIPVFLVNGRDS